jgi:hypothetical protein
LMHRHPPTNWSQTIFLKKIVLSFQLREAIQGFWDFVGFRCSHHVRSFVPTRLPLTLIVCSSSCSQQHQALLHILALKSTLATYSGRPKKRLHNCL